MSRKTKLGNHTAVSTDMSPLMANDDETVWKRMYRKANTKPMPRLMPMPPRTFFDDKHTAINVRMNDVAIAAKRL